MRNVRWAGQKNLIFCSEYRHRDERKQLVPAFASDDRDPRECRAMFEVKTNVMQQPKYGPPMELYEIEEKGRWSLPAAENFVEGWLKLAIICDRQYVRGADVDKLVGGVGYPEHQLLADMGSV
jgi:hypothetical protein